MPGWKYRGLDGSEWLKQPISSTSGCLGTESVELNRGPTHLNSDFVCLFVGRHTRPPRPHARHPTSPPTPVIAGWLDATGHMAGACTNIPRLCPGDQVDACGLRLETWLVPALADSFFGGRPSTAGYLSGATGWLGQAVQVCWMARWGLLDGPIGRPRNARWPARVCWMVGPGSLQQCWLCALHTLAVTTALRTLEGWNSVLPSHARGNQTWHCCGQKEGVESSGSYPMLNITELKESITHVLIVLSGGG